MNYAEKVWDTINRAWNGDSRLIKEEKINIPDQYELWASLHDVLKKGE